MKVILLFSFLSFTSISVLFAQETKIDSIASKTELIKKDIRHFYLSKQDWKACKKQHFKPTSDYFKPNATNIGNPDLLSDSVYVKAYRIAAFKKTKQKRKILKVELIGGIIGGVMAAAIVVIIVPYVLRFK